MTDDHPKKECNGGNLHATGLSDGLHGRRFNQCLGLIWHDEAWKHLSLSVSSRSCKGSTTPADKIRSLCFDLTVRPSVQAPLCFNPPQRTFRSFSIFPIFPATTKRDRGNSVLVSSVNDFRSWGSDVGEFFGVTYAAKLVTRTALTRKANANAANPNGNPAIQNGKTNERGHRRTCVCV